MLPDEKRDYEMYVHERMVHQFARKPSFNLAREIWLSGQDHSLRVPENVLSVFVEGIRKQVPTTRRKAGRRVVDNAILRGKIKKELHKQRMRNPRGAIIRTCEKLAQQEGKTEEAVRQLIHRMNKKT